MSERNRSFWIGAATDWDERPRWQRLGIGGAALLLAIGFCVKSAQIESVMVMSLSLMAGRWLGTLLDSRAGTGESAAATATGRRQ